ncbi:hypothetical protein MN116_008069 [Schistosoma mekongi]|uniref:Lebercilin domain-containing protein n=1 Tax=Schistosoma mekongi TaxID=38744 RepID=A0AAE1Z5S4_SCHME|nr:hypothetical protein MN116_008069 [Schistosoma mekongi]
MRTSLLDKRRMCNRLPDSQFILDYGETYATDSELTVNEDKNLRFSKESGLESKQHKKNNQNPKTLLRNINYKSKVSQHNSTIKSSSQSTSGQISSSISSNKPHLNNKYSSSIIARWESSQLALADANSIIVQLNKELKDCKLELKTLQRQYKLQAVRLDKAIGQEADMPQIVDRLNAEIRSLQIRLREKTQQSNVDQRKINELYQRIYVLEKTAMDEKHSQSQFNDEESTVTRQRSNKITDIPIDLKVEKKKNSQLQHQMDMLTKNHKHEINTINEKLRCLQRKCQQLEMKLHERTQQLHEKTKLLELQNVHNHCISKNVILPTSTTSSSLSIHLTNDTDNQIEHVHQLIDQNQHSSNDRQSLKLSQMNVNNDNVVINNQDCTVNELMNNENTQKLSNDEFNTDNEVTHDNQINEIKLQHNIENQLNNNDTGIKILNNFKNNDLIIHQQQEFNSINEIRKYETEEERKCKLRLLQTLQQIDKEVKCQQYEDINLSQVNSHQNFNNSINNNYVKTSEEQLWNDLFGSKKDNNSEFHFHNDENILKNNLNHSISEYSHNKNSHTIITHSNNFINDTMNITNIKQSPWLSFHKTINQLSNELNIEHHVNHIHNNNKQFNCITSHINDVDADIEELHI